MNFRESKLQPPKLEAKVPWFARPALAAFKHVTISRARREAKRSHEKNIHALMKALETCTKYRRVFENERIHAAAEIYRTAEFHLICQGDISILAHDVLFSSGWRQNLHARFLALTLFEVVEDLPNLLGTKFKNRISDLFGRPELNQKLGVITKALSNFRTKNEKKLRAIRKVSAAHRDPNPETLIQEIEGIDVDEILDLTKEFTVHSRALANFITTELLQNMDIRWMLTQFVNRDKSR